MGPSRSPPWTAPGAHMEPSGVSSRRLFAYKLVFVPKTLKTLIIFSRKHPRPPPSSTLDREGSEALPDTLSEGGIVTGGVYITMPASGVMRE